MDKKQILLDNLNQMDLLCKEFERLARNVSLLSFDLGRNDLKSYARTDLFTHYFGVDGLPQVIEKIRKEAKKI